MSHPLYNPYASGNQCSTQGQYGHSTVQPERDPRRGSSHLVSGSSFNTPGGHSTASTKPPGKIPPLMSQQVSYRPEQSRAIVDDDIQRSVDFHVSRAREEVRFLDKPTHQSINQSNRFTNTQRDEFLSSSTGMTSFPMSSTSASLGQRQSDTGSASSSLNWLSSYKKPTTEDSSNFFSSSTSSSYVSSSDSRFNPSSERDSNAQSIPGLGDFDYSNRPVSAESSRPKYTSESAANILLHFGLEKEDLEHLISYPEDQITPANLPFILRQIRIQKAKRTPTAAQSKSYSEPHPSRSMGDSLSTANVAARRQEEISSAVLQPSKVIDYGHTGKYTGGTGDEIGVTTGSRSNSSGSGTTLVMEAYDGSHSRESLKNKPTDMRSSALDSSHEKRSSVTNVLSSYRTEPDKRELSSLVPQSNDPSKRLQNQQTKQSSQIIQSSFSLPKQDTDIRVHKTETSKTLPSKDSKTSQASSKASTSTTLYRDVHPSRPGLVVIDSRGSTASKARNKTTGQGSITAEQRKKQQQQQPLQVQALWSPVFSAEKTTAVPPASLNTTSLSVPLATARSVFVPGSTCPIVIPSASPQGIPSLFPRAPMVLPSRQPPAAVAVSKGLPSPAMMQDYTAASPRIFPHTCSLCNKECGTTKDWISHQNTSLHLESCKVLRAKYPEWDGDILLGPSAAGKDAKPRSTTSAQSSQNRHQKTRRGRSSRSRSLSRSRSRSRSSSPCRHNDSRRDKRSRSRSPRSSRYSRRSRSRSPRYERQTSGRYRSRSRSHERRSSPRRRDEKWSSPRSEDRRSPRSRERRSPHRRSDARRPSPRRSRERRSSSEQSSPQHTRSSSAERLAKKLLQKTAAQSLSKPSELEAVVKSLAPALLAELAKMRSSATSSSSSPASKGEKSSRSSLTVKSKSSSSAASSTASTTTAKKKVSTSLKGKASLQKTEAGASTKTKLAKPSPPTMVKLQGIRSSLSHSDVMASVEQFGKTKSVVLFRSKLEAIVCFEKEEDAKKLKSINMFDMKGMSVSVANEKVTESKEQNVTSQKNLAPKPTSASVSTPQGSKSTATAVKPKSKKVVSTPGKTKRSSVTKSSTSSSAIKNTTNVSKAKALLSKAKSLSAEQKSKVDKSTHLPRVKATKHPETGTKTKRLTSNVTSSKTSGNKSTSAKPGTKPMTKGTTAKGTKVTSNKASEKVTSIRTSVNQKDTKVTSKKTAEDQKDAKVTSKKTAEDQKDAKVTSKDTAEDRKDTEPSKLKDSKPMEKESVPQAQAVDVKINEEKAELMEVITVETNSEGAEPVDMETCGLGKEENLTNIEDLPSKRNETPSPLCETTLDASPLKQASVSPWSTETTPDPAETNLLVRASLQSQQSVLPELESTAQGLETRSDDSQTHARSSPESALELETKTQKDFDTVAKNENDASSKDASSAVSNVSAAATSVKSKSTAALQRSQQATATAESLVAEKAEKPAESSSPAFVTITEMVNLQEKHIPCIKKETCFKKKFPSLGFHMLLITNLQKCESCYTEEDIANLLIPSGFVHKDETIYIIPQAGMAFAVMPAAVNVQHVLKRCSERQWMTFKNCKVKVSVVACNVEMTRLGFYKYLMNKMKMPVTDGTKIIYIKNISESEATDLKEALKNIGGVANYFPLLNKVFIEFKTVFHADRIGVWYNLLKQAPNHQVYRLLVPQGRMCAPPPRLSAHALPDSKHVVAVAKTQAGVPQGTVAPFWVTLTSSPFVFPTSSPWFNIPDFSTVHTLGDIQRAKREATKVHTVMMTGLAEGHYKHEDVAKLVWRYFPSQRLTDLYYHIIVLPLQKRAFVHFNNWAACRSFAEDHIRIRSRVRGTTLMVHFVLEQMCLQSKEELMYANLMKWSNARVPDVVSLEERLLCVEISEISVAVIKLVLEAVSSIATFVSFLPLANRICVEMADPSGVTQVLENYNTFTTSSFQRDFIWNKVVRFERLKNLKQRLEDSRDLRINLDANTIRVKESVTASSSATATSKCEEASQSTPSPAAPAEETSGKLPLIDDNTFKIITAAVREHRLTRETPTENLDKESKSSESLKHKPKNKDQVDFTDDDVSSHAYFFHELSFNMEDFVTVDEVGDDMGDNSPDHPSSSSSPRERSESLSTAKYVSTKTSKDTKSSASSPPPTSSSSMLDKGSMKSSTSSISTSVSKDSCGSTTKASSSARVSNTSVSTDFASVESELHGEKARNTEDTETTFGHSVSPNDCAAKTVESDTKIELQPEMHPPALSQSLQKDDIMKEKRSKEEGKEGSTDKYAKEEVDDDENYQILDSLEPTDDGDQESKLETCLPESEKHQSLVEEVFQVLDSVDDEANVCPQDSGEMEMDPSFKVLDSITEEQAAASQDISPIVNDEPSRGKTLPEEDVIQVLSLSDDKSSTGHTNSNSQEKDSRSQMIDTGSKQALSVKEDTEEEQLEESRSKMLSGQSSKDTEDDDHVHNEDQPLEDRDLLGDVNEQETFEVLDSIEDQIEMEDEKPKSPSEVMSKEDIHAAAIETDPEPDKETRSKREETTMRKDNRQSKRSSIRSRTPKSEQSRTKPDTAACASRTGSEITEEMVFEIVDSVEDEPVQDADTTERSGRRRSARGKREDGSKDTHSYKIVDSVDKETGNDETTVTTRSTRGRREKTANDLWSDKSKTEEIPTRRRHTPARDSQEKATKKEENASSKESSPTKKRDNRKEASEEAPTYEILDSVEEENVKHDQPVVKTVKRKRGRPKKESVTLKKPNKDSDKLAEEEEVTYQILDSVEDEVVDDEPPECSETVKMESISKNEDQQSESTSRPPKTEDEEEEPVYQIVDSVEEDQVHEEPVTTVVTKCGNLAKIGEDVKTSDKGQESDDKCDTLVTTSTLVKLDEVSEDEEDFPDDTAEKEELRRKQAATKNKHLANEQTKAHEERMTRGREERERRSRSSRRGSGGTDGEALRGAKAKERKLEEELKELEVDPKELLTLDEVGADEGGEETSQGQEWDADIPEAELQALVTLDEIVEEEDEERKVEPPCEGEKSAEYLNPETLVTLDESGADENKLEENQAEMTFTKRKRDDTEENIKYVTVDEVGENEDETQKEVTTTRTRGRPRKRTRQTPVRKSFRGRNVNVKEEKESSGSDVPPPTSLDSSSSLDKDLSMLSDSQTENLSAISAGEEQPANQSHDECVEQGEEEKEGWSRANVKVARKRTKELVGPGAKRSRSQSPCVVADFKLPPFNPSNPLGQDFVIPKSGYYCNLCSVFYLNETSAKDLHCSSQRHYDNLQNYYQKLQQKPSSSTQNPQGFTSE